MVNKEPYKYRADLRKTFINIHVGGGMVRSYNLKFGAHMYSHMSHNALALPIVLFLASILVCVCRSRLRCI